MAVELEKSFLRVMKTKRKMVRYATHFAETDITVSVPYAGRTAQMSSEKMVPSATSRNRMDVELAQSTSVTIVRSGVLFGTLNAVKTSIMLLAVFAHLTARPA